MNDMYYDKGKTEKLLGSKEFTKPLFEEAKRQTSNNVVERGSTLGSISASLDQAGDKGHYQN